MTSPLPELVREEDGGGGLVRRYVYGADLVSLTDPSGSYFYHHDALGSVVNLTDPAGQVAASYEYEPFGVEESPPSGPDNLMRFTGEYLDEETGLYHLRARQYEPSLGRFLSADPLAPALTDPYVSAYVYANNRPTSAVDPSGLRYEVPILEDLSTNPVDVWKAGLPNECNSPGYRDYNLSFLLISTGVYVDACGQLIVYIGGGFGTPGASITESQGFVSCDSTSAQVFALSFVGGAAGRGKANDGKKGWFTEHGAGVPGGGVYRNFAIGC